MRTVLVIALSFGIVVAGSASARTGEASGKPKLQVLQGASLALRGTQFVPGERITVSVSGPGRSSKRTVADGRGGFLVRFRMRFDRCNSNLIARAVGSRGSRAGVKTPPLLCPPRL